MGQKREIEGRTAPPNSRKGREGLFLKPKERKRESESKSERERNYRFTGLNSALAVTARLLGT